MRKLTKRIIVTVLLIAMVCAVAVHFNAVSLIASEGYYYSIDTSTTASVYGRYVDDPDVVIVREFSDHYITAIANNAFIDDAAIVTLDLTPANLLEKIGNYAFYNCSNLSGSVIFAGRVNSIGLSAFQGCGSLSSALFYSSGVTLIPEQCFYQCSSLSSVKLPDKLQKIDKLAFADCTSLTEITIPRSVTEIHGSAFNGDTGLTIKCYYDTYAHHYAETYGINYVILDPENIPQDPTEPPTTLPTEPPTEAPVGYLLGDTDNDGDVSVVDATWVQRAVAEMDIAPVKTTVMQGNVDGDDLLTVIDATFIMRYTVNIATPYAIGERVVNS